MLNDGSFVLREQWTEQAPSPNTEQEPIFTGLDCRKRRAVSLTWSISIANDRPWQAIDEADSDLQRPVTRRPWCGESVPVCEASDAANATSVAFERGVHRSRSCLWSNRRNTEGQLSQADRGHVSRLLCDSDDRTGNNCRSKAYSTEVPQPQRQNAGSKTQSKQLSHARTALLSEVAASARAPEPLAPPASQAGISLPGLTRQHATASLQQAGQPASCPAAYGDAHRSASASMTATPPAAYSAAPRSSPAVQPSVLAAVPSRRHQGARQKAFSDLNLPLGVPSQGLFNVYQARSEPEGRTSDSHVPLTAAAAAASKGQFALYSSAAGVSESSTSTTINTESLLQGWISPMQPPVPSHLPSLEELACGNTAGLRPQTVNKTQLDAARPLQQVSRQFVPLVCGRTVAIMDQHAAAERVRLEELQDEVINEQGYPRQAESTRLRPPQPLELSPSEQQVLLHHKAHAEAWGWQFAESECGSASKPVLTHAAAVLGSPLNATELQSFLHQLKRTNSVARVPQGVHRLLISKACHSAIRFGDPLSTEQCEQLLAALRRTRSWHCCAHGRPTVLPLVELTSLHAILKMRGAMQG